jgi:23S rRNA pseudouridine2605 synthase
MRLNKFIAQSTGLSRRAADAAIAQGRVSVNGREAALGKEVGESDTVVLDNSAITPAVNTVTIMLNKPVGYVCSRNGQGSKTVYDLLPPEYQQLKPVGRLDKDSSGLLLMTNDGDLAYELTHPSIRNHSG